ncbi:MAG TPA: hypothetical protein PLO37_24520 [Candidatus Hydrogenedentes bacterium]|nr:hypothetical protein [Candidatus Hydrogenedentota bacterium]HPG70026.1 hypothetical protein [Candidatus Hydrogenedentota bacterium]
MNLMALGIAVLALVAADEDQPPPPVSIRVVAVQASDDQEGEPKKQALRFGSGTEEIRTAIGDLKFDNYKLVKASTVTAQFNQESRVPIDNTYTLYLQPLSRESGGRVKLNVRVTMPGKTPQAEPVNALKTTVIAAPGNKFKLRGLELDDGELVLVLTVRG